MTVVNAGAITGTLVGVDLDDGMLTNRAEGTISGEIGVEDCNRTEVAIDRTGNGTAETVIDLAGQHDLVLADFVLVDPLG